MNLLDHHNSGLSPAHQVQMVANPIALTRTSGPNEEVANVESGPPVAWRATLTNYLLIRLRPTLGMVLIID
jgi:hypothetical protein